MHIKGHCYILFCRKILTLNSDRPVLLWLCDKKWPEFAQGARNICTLFKHFILLLIISPCLFKISVSYDLRLKHVCTYPLFAVPSDVRNYRATVNVPLSAGNTWDTTTSNRCEFDVHTIFFKYHCFEILC